MIIDILVACRWKRIVFIIILSVYLSIYLSINYYYVLFEEEEIPESVVEDIEDKVLTNEEEKNVKTDVGRGLCNTHTHVYLQLKLIMFYGSIKIEILQRNKFKTKHFEMEVSYIWLVSHS